jgi:putative Holliday junction resolvase
LQQSAERILALDLGTKRIGLALSDELGFTAQGLDTLVRKNKRTDLDALHRLVRERGVTLILVGLPLHMSGEEGRQADWAREFAQLLGNYTGVPVILRDERWTSREAERTLRGAGVANGDRKAAIDRVSAAILLQSYLDSRAFQTPEAAS